MLFAFLGCCNDFCLKSNLKLTRIRFWNWLFMILTWTYGSTRLPECSLYIENWLFWSTVSSKLIARCSFVAYVSEQGQIPLRSGWAMACEVCTCSLQMGESIKLNCNGCSRWNLEMTEWRGFFSRFLREFYEGLVTSHPPLRLMICRSWGVAWIGWSWWSVWRWTLCGKRDSSNSFKWARPSWPIHDGMPCGWKEDS